MKLNEFLPEGETVAAMVVQNGVLIIATQRSMWCIVDAGDGESATLGELEFQPPPQEDPEGSAP